MENTIQTTTKIFYFIISNFLSTVKQIHYLELASKRIEEFEIIKGSFKF